LRRSAATRFTELAHRMVMTTNQLFVRDFTLMATGLTAVIAVALGLAPAPIADHSTPISVAPHGQSVGRAGVGARLYRSKGCVTCHTVDGSARVGPTFLHDFGSRIVLASGDTITMDRAYIRESLMSPQAKARPGYPPTMPSFEGLLNEREIEGLSAYVESLR
jgi:mono/diheme cytochrome c family protein